MESHPQNGNLFASVENSSGKEIIESLLSGGEFRVKRIVSTGQTTPPGQWYDQEQDEWVVLLQGAATLQFEDEAEPRQLKPGDFLNIAAHRRHRVEWTDPGQATVWLAIYYS